MFSFPVWPLDRMQQNYAPCRLVYQLAQLKHANHLKLQPKYKLSPNHIVLATVLIPIHPNSKSIDVKSPRSQS